jgi:hypothetical protein
MTPVMGIPPRKRAILAPLITTLGQFEDKLIQTTFKNTFHFVYGIDTGRNSRPMMGEHIVFGLHLFNEVITSTDIGRQMSIFKPFDDMIDIVTAIVAHLIDDIVNDRVHPEESIGIYVINAMMIFGFKFLDERFPG